MFAELFYWFYEILKKDRPNDSPCFDAFLGISVLQCFNVGSLLGVVNYFLAIKISKNVSVIIGVVLYVLITTINFFVLYRRKYEIIKKFENSSDKRQKRGKLYFWIYALTTMAFCIFVLANFTPKQ
ncbi:MAG: hypothetical protein Q8905_10260 [Bacteroidota bacterium]|nr:hypothetical protein [Bacteroidota bacterium]